MADKMFFIKVPEDASEDDIRRLTEGLSDLADATEKQGSRWGFAIIPRSYDPMAHGEIQVFLKELLAVVKEQLGAEKILEIIKASVQEPK